MKIEELSLFDFNPVFDPKKANWKKGVYERKYCDVIAYIPEHALAPIEQGYTGPSDRQKERNHQIWCDHAISILHYLGKDTKWQQATKLLISHRKKNEPIRLRIYEWRMKRFKNTQIVEYL